MNDIVIRIPWNKTVALRVSIAVLIAIPILYIALTHGLMKHRIGFSEDENSATPSEYGWIVTLRDELPFEDEYGPRYSVCMDGFGGDRVYVWGSSSGFDAGRAYFDKDGKFMGEWYHGDAGDIPKDFIGDRLHACTRVPAWFFDRKVDKSSIQE